MIAKYTIKTGSFGTYVFDNVIRQSITNDRNIELLNIGNVSIKFIKTLKKTHPDLYKGFLLNNFNYCDKLCNRCKFVDNCDGSPQVICPDEFI